MCHRRKQTACLVALAVVAAIAPAAPASAAPSTVALWLDGREALRLHATVAAALPAEWTALPARTVAHAVPAVTRAHRGLGERLHALGERLHAQAALYVRVEPRAHQLLLVVARAGGEPVERHLAPRALQATLAELLREPAASAPVAAAAPAPRSAIPSPRVAAAPKRAVEKQPAPAPAPASAPPPGEPSGDNELVARAAAPSPPGAIFALALDGGVGARRLTYNQALTPNLPTYSVAAVPLLGFRAALYPLARTGVAFLRDLGAVGGFDRSLYQQSTVEGVAGNASHESATWTMFDVGLRERIRFHTARPSIAPTLGVALAYGGQSFIFDDGGIPLSQTPSVDYRYVRPAVDARIAIGRVTLFADFGYRFILSSGYIGSRFPHASVGGLDVGAGIAIALPRDFELCLRGRYDRFFYDLHPQPGDPYVAGGALDEYAVGELALAYGF
jgi:hypothetical protein